MIESKRMLIAGCLLACAGTLTASSEFDSSFRNPPPGYGEVPFWWWSGEKLDKDRLLWQLDELHRAGVAGMQVNYSHLCTDGWKTASSCPEIFSDEWWDIFSFVAVECAKRGMGIGLSGYTLDWPGRDNLYRKLGISAPETCGKGAWADDYVKHPENGPSSNILIEDCIFENPTHSCLTLGSECPEAHGVVMRNCRMERAGAMLYLKMRTDTPQRYANVLVENMTGNCGDFLKASAWTQYADFGGRTPADTTMPGRWRAGTVSLPGA